MEFVGSLGTLIVSSPFKPEASEIILLRRGDEEQSIRVRGPKLLYSGEVEDMADAVLLGKPQHVSLADSRANVAAILALLQSAKEGRPVRLGS
jgi:predicted dehydrogenase